MQLRCTYCQTMFAVSREETLAALEHMEEEKLKFYDAHCPKCRRANRVECIKFEFSYPGWRNDIKKMAKEASGTSQPAAPTPAHAPEPDSSAASLRKKHLHKPAAGTGSAKAAVAKKPAAISSPKGKPAPKPAAISSPKGKPSPKTGKKAAAKPAPKTAKKPAAKKPATKPAAGTKKK